MKLTIFAQYWVISQYNYSCNFLLKIPNLLVNIGQIVLSSMVGQWSSEIRIYSDHTISCLTCWSFGFWARVRAQLSVKGIMSYQYQKIWRGENMTERSKLSWSQKLVLLFCSCWFCWLQIEEEDIVFLCSCKCHTTNLFKVQTLKVGNQLENFLLFCPLEQSCDIRGKRLTFTQAKDNQPDFKQQKSALFFYKL